MPSERVQRQIDSLLDDAEAAVAEKNWARVREFGRSVLAADPENQDARVFLAMADAAEQTQSPSPTETTSVASSDAGLPASQPSAPPLPASFAGGRYAVRAFLGEGAKKRVYLVHDEALDRECALALIKTDAVEPQELDRLRREAQAMARLDHPNIVAVYDISEEDGRPFLVCQYISGGDLRGELRAAGGPLPMERALSIAEDVCRALAHAHEHGIVHRDVKPANVLLTSDGAAKLGDFGLAAAVDRSRLTLAGTFVGTAAYIAPEQALGQPADARSDLYALGCVLYELLTGRPPFLGDDALAVISQHINTPPVAPSWLTDRCPPDLEELILRLLAKDPGERPASSAEVLQALERVDPAQKSASHEDGANPLERLARGVFVGRQKELERLRKAFDEAFAGRGGIVMLVGEPGIGKTRAARELQTYARVRGAQALWGRAHESSGAPAYWPWVEVGEAYRAARNLADLDFQGKGPILGGIFPFSRQQPGYVEPEPLADPEAAQFRLFDAFLTFVRAMSGQVPLLILLDDLHWADKPSLLLLQHVARELSRMRVLVVCTYRDTELSRTHPLSETLARLNREAGFERMVLRGLSREEVAAYIRAAASVEPKRELLDRVFEETEGNPFFLSEVVNLMAQEGKLTAESVSDIAIPDGVREALGRRLDRISEGANELLQTAAVVGREFTYEMLSLTGARGDEELLRLVEEALEARVIEEADRPGRYRFTHALMQETLLQELSTTRRVRLHGTVGEALERSWGARADERASRLALHFVEAAMVTPRHAAKAVRYSKLAALQAEAQFAWDEAAQQYERCLTLVTEADDRLGEDEAALFEAQGRCLRAAADIRGAWRSIMRALTLYRERGDGLGFARAFLEIEGVYADEARVSPLRDEAIAGCGGSDPHLRARLLASRGRRKDLEDATEIARLHGFKDVEARLLEREAGIAFFGRRDVLRFVELNRRSHDMMLEAGEPMRAVRLYIVGLNGVAILGSTELLEAAASEALEEARRLGERRIEEHANFWLATFAWLRCDFERYEQLMENVSANQFWGALLRVRDAEQRGDLERAIELMPDERSAGTGLTFRIELHANRARVLGAARRSEAAQVELKVLAALVPKGAGLAAAGVFTLYAASDQLSEAFGTEGLRAVYDRWSGVNDFRLSAPGWPVDLTLGLIALELGLVDDAERHLRTGLAWCEQEHWPVEQGRCLAGLAEVAERRGERAEALSLLHRAAALFRQHGAKLYLDRVIAAKVRVQGIGSGQGRSIDAVLASVQSEHPDLAPMASPDGTVTIMFSDIEGSTVLTERLGDQAWLELLRQHNAIIRKQLRAYDGFEVKTIGDCFMVAFQSAKKGLDCAVAIQRAFADRRSDVGGEKWGGSTETSSPTSHLSEPIRVRIGLHAGEAIRDGDDFYGKNVILASRVAGKAVGGEILVSSLVRQLVESSVDAGTFADAREMELKGLTGTHTVYAVRLDGGR